MSHVITITGVLMRENTVNIQSAKTLRSDASLPLDQIVNIIHIDYMIDQSNECVKISYTLIIVAGM